MAREVRVLDAPVADRGGRGLDLFVRHRRAALGALGLDERERAGHSLVEQVDEADGVARASLELFAVLAKHDAKAHVLDALERRVKEPHLAAALEDALEMRRLARVDDVERPVCGLNVHAVAERCKVRGCVREAAVGLAHNERLERRVRLLGVREPDKHRRRGGGSGGGGGRW
eukprot:Amastigsp_a176976_43.p3 type:complete len:173 gc:universal Amastigsp_a176976_43:1012-494(-)